MKKTIRAAAVAKHIGISSQELRKMLSEVNFGIKPTDREFPFMLIPGIIRFSSRKLKREIAPFPLPDSEEDTEEDSGEIEGTPADEAEVPEEQVAPEKEKTKAPESVFQTMSRLAKKKHDTKKAEEKPTTSSPSPAIFRKIEIDPAVSAQAKKDHEEEEKKTKDEREQELQEKKAMLRRKKKSPELVKKEGVIEIPEMISIKEFSEKVGVPSGEIIAVLMKNGLMATVNQSVDFQTLSIVALEIDVEIKKEESEASAEDLKNRNIQQLVTDEPENMLERAPVVVVMGHVDHGKTSVLDTIRKTKVTSGEAGGITQHIGAYQIEKNGKLLTFLDTPGHEAFTAMRARGAHTADIAILVVAADEGIKPQTIEAIHHAQEAELPIIVAINKIDKSGIQVDKVKGELSAEGLNSEDWGGDTTMVLVSALTGEGIEELIEMIILQSQLMDLTANPNRLAVGTVVESHLNSSLGPIATVLVNTGTLKIGDDFVLGESAGRIKTMLNDELQRIEMASPSAPVEISGLSTVPSTGEVLQVFPSAKIARQKAEEFQTLSQENASNASLSDIMAGLQTGKIKFLKIVLKADTEGSLEAVRQTIEKIQSDEVAPKIIHMAVGSITETDIMMASASQGIVIGFHVLVSPRIQRIAEKQKVEVQSYDIIYQISDDVRDILTGLLEPEVVETITGELLVKQVFYTKKKMMIVGGKVTKGYLENTLRVRIYRGEGEEPVGTGKIASLQHFEKKVPRIEENQECGIQFEGRLEIEEGDRIEVFTTEERMKTL